MFYYPLMGERFPVTCGPVNEWMETVCASFTGRRKYEKQTKDRERKRDERARRGERESEERRETTSSGGKITILFYCEGTSEKYC